MSLVIPSCRKFQSLACNFAAKLMFVIDILILLTVSDTLLLKNLVVNPVNI